MKRNKIHLSNKYSVSLEEFRKKLDLVDSHDFDGHSDFKTLAPEEKLSWLSQAVQFYYEYGQKK